MSGVRPYERILAGVDFRPPARDAAALGVALARLSGAELILAAVFPYGPGPALGDDFERWLQEDTERLTTDVLPDLEGLNFRIYGLGGGSPARKLHELAEDESADLIVLGSTHRGALGRVVPGSVGERLLHGAASPVVIAPRGLVDAGWQLNRKVGVAFDGSPESRVALGHAAVLAEAAGVPLRIIGVVDPFVASPFDPAVPREVEAAAEHGEAIDERRHRILEEHLQQAIAELPPELDAGYEVLEGNPAEQLIALSAKLGLLVLGSRGYGPLRHVFLGGVSGAVTRGAHCPTLVVPRGAPAGDRITADEIEATSAPRG